MIKKSISDFYKSFYIPENKNLEFRLSHVCILETNHCGNTCREEFKRRREFKDVLCRSDYADRVIASFSYQIQY